MISEASEIAPGEPFEVALYIEPEEHWHVYWQNPGDAGLAPILTWDLPEGYKASEIHYLAPSRIEAGPLVAYGYDGPAMYPVTITPPENLTIGDPITLQVKADWLVCREECLPGAAELQLTVGVSELAKPGPDADLFAEARELIPRTLPEGWARHALVDDSSIQVLFSAADFPSQANSVNFYAGDKSVIDHAAEQRLSVDDASISLNLTRSLYSMEKPKSIHGVLELTRNGTKDYYNIDVLVREGPTEVAQAGTTGLSGILGAIIFAFLGGLILNLMPCVLPVLSLKVLGLVNQAQQGGRSALHHGLVFTAGVIVSFWAIVGVMLVLQAGGAQLGWGFQLQSPAFVMVLAGFMFLFALSLFGVFEIGFLSMSGGVLESKSHGGLSGAFVSGISATLVATPCTAPFMGAALGFSLTQPPLVSLAVYTSLALGMASPYLALSAFPRLLKFVPKPGKWMETLKQAMGFVLAATVIWLGWVLSAQSGTIGLTALMGVLLLLSVAAWVYGRWGSVSASGKSKFVGRTAAVLVMVLAVALGNFGLTSAPAPGSTLMSESGGIPWQEFSQSRLSDLRSDGHPVFIDFTASWCLSCQVNERVALSTDEVTQKFDDLGVVPLKADWTSRSDDITQALAAFGRNSVPLYVLYGPGPDSEPILLPEIITPGIVLDALNELDSQHSELSYLKE